MATVDLGNNVNQIVNSARTLLFRQSELAQLTYGAFDIAYRKVQGDTNDTIELAFPVGMSADHQPITSTRKYSKQELLTQYQFLAINQLARNGVVQLVAVMEAMTEDLLRAVYTRYPEKLGKDKKISIGSILESASIDAVHTHAIDTLMNELSYKSPAEFAEDISKQFGINLLECGAFHRYMELKATRDVYIHNRGIANRLYTRKAGLHARVPAGQFLPIDMQYFLEIFEQCIQLTEWWEKQLHDKWYSSELEARKAAKQMADKQDQTSVDVMSEQLRKLAAKYAQPKRTDDTGGASG